MVVSSPQCGENTAFFSGFPLGGIQGQGILPVIPLELQGKKHQPFSITQSFLKVFDWQEAVRREFLPYGGKLIMRGLPCSASWWALAYGVRGW